MSTESDTPRTDALMPDQGQKRTMLEHIEAMEAHARQLERELNDVTTDRNNLDASLTAAISSSNARHFESMEHEAKSKQLDRELNEAKDLLRFILPDWSDEVDQPCKNKVCAEITQYDVAMIRDFLSKTKLTNETK